MSEIKPIHDPHTYSCPKCGSPMRFDEQTHRIICSVCGFEQVKDQPPPVSPPRPPKAADRNHCPRCGGQMKIDAANKRVVCGHCGYTPFDETEMERKAAELKSRAGLPAMDITHVGEIHPWAMAAFETGQDCLARGDKAGALQAFQKALDSQPDFADAHLWIAKVSDDPQVKRQHLDTVYAANPRNAEAIRMLMVLNGRLTPEEAARSARSADPELKQASEPVKTQTVALECPICQGDLTVDDASGRVECRFCGYKGQRPASRGAADDSLTAALLERRGQAVQWVIGERLLHCNRCGAERTIAADVLSMRCPFCGSNQVIQQDVLKSFQQPDGVIPFQVTRDQAEAAIHEQLNSLGQRLAGLFTEHHVKEMTIEGVFLPFWIFDAAADVTQRIQYDEWTVQDYASFSDGLWNEPVCAVNSPPRLLVGQIQHQYDMTALTPYDPKMLAKHPASLYTTDFDRASLEARGTISEKLREKHHQASVEMQASFSRGSSRRSVKMSVFVLITQMSFRLALLPVWVATLVEHDHHLRTALVNGQTGKVTLGKTRKPEN